MCELCSSDAKTKANAQESQQILADRFYRIARYYERLAIGRDKPHDAGNIERIKHDMRFATKQLVEDWL